MKKTIALCLAGAMGLATCGLAACGESGGNPTASEDPETFVSDKIETDEQWDKAMWDTFTYLFDFEGEDDPTKTYEKFPYWHPVVRSGFGAFDHDLKLARDKNFKVDIFMDATAAEESGGYERWSSSTVYDMGKYHSLYEYAGEYTDSGNGGSSVKEVTKSEEYMKYNKAGELMRVGKITVDESVGKKEDPLNVWSNDLHVSSTGTLAIIENFFNCSHFGVLKNQGNTYFNEHSSILEFAKYDEEKGGYVITDKELLTNIKAFSVMGETAFTFKFKDGMLVGAWYEETYGTTVMKEGFTITYGGQNVTFPDNLPW